MIDFQPTILLVDDAQVNLALLAGILKNSYNIKVAKSGEKALEIIASGGVDLVLLDVVMPNMDGYEVCQILKSKEQTKDIPIIFVTANTDVEDEEKGFKLGAVDYILKPFKETIVKARVKTHINLRLRQIELETIYKTLQDQNQKLSRYTNVIDNNVITSSTDLMGNITHVSEAFCKISKYSKGELIGRKQNIIRHPDMPDEFYKNMWQTITNDQEWEGEIKNINKEGGSYWVKAHITPDFENGKKIGYTAVRQDITDKKEIERISITDGLTNIFNRRYFNETFPKVINSNKRNNGLVCFLLMDIDHFKQYNDNYGHQAGDGVLIQFAQALKSNLKRGDDTPFRLGGEEFGILYRAESKEKAYIFADLILHAIEDLHITHEYNSASKYITASMGLVCEYAEDIKDMDAIYKQADDLLYESKKNGRNQITTRG